MAREGYLIIDSDLHMNEPDDLWARYLDEPYRANPPRSSAASSRPLTQSTEDKGNADSDQGHGGAGPCDPGVRQVGRARPRPAASCGAAAARATRISTSRGRAASIPPRP